MTVTAAGAFSGRLTLGSEAARSFTGAFALNLDAGGSLTGAPSTSFTIPGTKSAPPVTISFTLQRTTSAIDGEPPSTVLVSSTISYRSDSVNFTAWRNNFASRAVPGVSRIPTGFLRLSTPAAPALPAPVATLYNFALTHSLVGDADILPQGAGYASFTLSTSGAYTLAGRTADGESLTGSYWLGPDGQLFVYQVLYRTVQKGSIRGVMQIERASEPSDNDITGTLDWVRPLNPAATHRLYKAGFGLPGTPVTSPVLLNASGGCFVEQPVTTGTIFGNSAPVTANLEFSEHGEFSAVPQDSDVDTAIGSNPDLIGITVGAGSRLTSIPNILAGTKLTPNHKTGALTGTFTLVDDLLKRRVTFQGLTVRVRTSAFGAVPRETRETTTYGTGYFILDTKPVGLQKPSATPQRSGIFSFKGN